MFVGEGPGKKENVEGQPFVGPAGQKLDELITLSGLDSSVCRWGNLVGCIPWEVQGKSVRAPEEHEMDMCSPYIEKDIIRHKPVIIVTLGRVSTQYFTGIDKITKARGRRHPIMLPTVRFRYIRMMEILSSRGISDPSLVVDKPARRERAIERAVEKYGYKDIPQFTATVFPTYHPAAILYGNPDAEKDLLADLNYLASRVSNTDETANYHLMTSLDEIQLKINQVTEDYRRGLFPFLSYDIESTSLRVFDLREKITTIGLGYKPGEAWIIPYDHRESPFKGDKLAIKAINGCLNRMFLEVPVVGHNIKFDYEASYVRGIEIKEIYDDTEIQSWSLFNDQTEHDLETLTSRYTELTLHKQEMKEAQDGMPKEEKYNTDNYDLELIGNYNGADVDSCTRLQPVFESKLKELNLYEAHKKIAIPAIIPTAHMEINGCALDLDFNQVIAKDMKDEIDSYYEQFEKWGITELVLNEINDPRHYKNGKPGKKKFSLGSPDQISLILFYILELPGKKLGKVRTNGLFKGKKVPSSDKKVKQELLEYCNDNLQKCSDRPESEEYQLWELRLQVIKILQEHSGIAKLYSSYVKSLPKKMYPDGYVRPEYGIRHTETGRYNCKNPSLQTIPWHSVIKKMFVSRYENGVIISGDASQMELRVFAMATGDPELIRTFNEGRDIHRMISSRVLNCKEHEVPDHERRRIKTVVFGLLYGRGPGSIAAQEGMSKEEAKGLIAGVFQQFPTVEDFIIESQAFVRRHGYIPYINGFRRLIPYEENAGREERQAVNSRIQGPASDLGVSTLIDVFRSIRKLRFHSKVYQFVHDSLGFDVSPGELYDLGAIMKKSMEEKLPIQFPFINVPLKMDFEVGITWGHFVSMEYLDGRRLKFSGKQDYFDPFMERMMCWDDSPSLESYETRVKKEPKVIRSLLKTSDLEETVDVTYVDAVVDFPKFSRREPRYIRPAFIPLEAQDGQRISAA
ncbi:MAG: DNA polymerase [Gammaproteobacteria bacterium]|nr:DNA polymerase [Gammaproteobacteria bacterium]